MNYTNSGSYWIIQPYLEYRAQKAKHRKRKQCGQVDKPRRESEQKMKGNTALLEAPETAVEGAVIKPRKPAIGEIVYVVTEAPRLMSTRPRSFSNAPAIVNCTRDFADHGRVDMFVMPKDDSANRHSAPYGMEQGTWHYPDDILPAGSPAAQVIESE